MNKERVLPMRLREVYMKGNLLSKRKIDSQDDLFNFLKVQLHNKADEIFCLCFVDNDNNVLAWTDTSQLSRRSRSEVQMSLLDISRMVVILEPTGVYMTHNHPQGSTNTSEADKIATQQVKQLVEFLGVEFKGHYLVAGQEVIDITNCYLESGD